ncbi:ATP-binding protein [Cellulomonas sp. URHB0016]
MSERETWTVTTHEWSQDVDRAHLAGIRQSRTVYGAGGRRHLILEVLAYADEEAESLGRVGRAAVTTHADGSVTVADDGRGTDTRTDTAGNVVRKPVMATRDVRFFGAPDAPRLPDGLPRHGISTVAALSAVLVHENHRATGAWSQTYRYGVPDGELRPVRAARASGTSVTFRPDPDVGEPWSLVDDDLSAFRWLRVDLSELP